MRIPTGGMLPAGATGVVMVEGTTEIDGAVEVRDESHCADNITAAAADIRAGQRLLEKGTVLDAASIGMLAGAGVAQVDVYRKPLVGIIITGDELVPPGEPLAPGEIRDINRFTITAALAAMGFEPKAYPRVADDFEAFSRAFAAALDECEAVVISGGSSVGKRDYAAEIVGRAGKPGVVVHGVRVKPGRPTLLAVLGDKPIIGLPGNPVSALVMLESLGKPVLLRMFEKTDDVLPYRAILGAPIDVDGSLEHRIPVRLRRASDGSLLASPVLGTSAQMHILGMADAFTIVPMGVTRLETGEPVDCIPFTRNTTLR
jgi:molybdopterin molybdotransferase